ncbi:hypothetical protein [Undibacterium rugosum]|uniref:hypothetical protein n=1 Tax=Undibacterium rugosum TaxID=2762291 RepID=UPI001B81AA78|nr:hypothetical protein [Undibacterium rugosum]MBR7778908.1 hypothetical protein [Undibacterium rugosum]
MQAKQVINSHPNPFTNFDMNNPSTPPKPPLADISSKIEQPSWLRTLLLVVGFGVLSLALAWLVIPCIVEKITYMLGISSVETPPVLLILDILLSTLAFFASCYLAAKFSRGHVLFAAAGVGFIGWIVYFLEVGGLDGIVTSEFPFWYEFFPSHLLPVYLAWFVVKYSKS